MDIERTIELVVARVRGSHEQSVVRAALRELVAEATAENERLREAMRQAKRAYWHGGGSPGEDASEAMEILSKALGEEPEEVD